LAQASVQITQPASSRSPPPHPHPEPDGLAHFEVGDETGHAPVVELAAADFEMSGEFLFGDQVEFGARRG